MARIIISILLIFFSFQSYSQIAMFHAHNQMPNDNIFDQTTNAITGYSVRKISSTYTGALMRIYRASDQTQLDIGYTVNGDLDTAAIKSFVSTKDAFVVRWYDQSGNARHTEVVGGTVDTFRFPRIAIAGVIQRVNTKPSLYFRGVNGGVGNLLIAKFTSIATTAQSTFCVFNHNASASFTRIISQRESLKQDFEAGIIPILRSGTTTTWGTFNATAVVSTITLAANTTYVWSTLHTGSTIKNSINVNSEVTSSHSLNTNVIRYTIGAGAGYTTTDANDVTNSAPYVGFISESIWYSIDQSAKKSFILGNINTYYTIY